VGGGVITTLAITSRSHRLDFLSEPEEGRRDERSGLWTKHCSRGSRELSRGRRVLVAIINGAAPRWAHVRSSFFVWADGRAVVPASSGAVRTLERCFPRWMQNFGFVPPSLRPSPQFGPRLEGGMASPMSSCGRDLTLPWQLGGSVARVPLLSAPFWRGTVATWVVVPGCLLFFHLRTPWPGTSDRVPCLKPVQRRGPRVPLSQVSVRPAREYKSRAAQDRDSSPTTR
jgi:hypothetical protein